MRVIISHPPTNTQEDKTYKVNLDVHNRARPPVEPKNFIGKVDTLVSSKVVDSLTSSAGSRRDVLRAKLLVEACLEGGDLLGCIFAHAALGLFKWIFGHGPVGIGHRDTCRTAAMLVTNTGHDAISSRRVDG